MKTQFGPWASFAVLTLMLTVTGCQNTAEGIAQDTNRNTQVVAEETREAGQKIEEGVEQTGAAVKEGAETAGAAVVTGAKKAGEAVENVGERSEDLTRVKAAFAANAKLSAFQIDVDTMADGTGVVLKGSVATAEEKALAERVAKQTLEQGKKVQNQLTVGR
ncbi:MAG: BON domain-containing protein [Capsulimonadales bacterium]|nr:BON domain-containing protein [Capsulimonadales bacterium]